MVSKKKKETTIDDLAIMIGKGFGHVDEQLNSLERGQKEIIESNAREHKEIIESNTREHEEIKLRLDNVAYRFELIELQKRVEVLERRTGLRTV